MNNKKGQILLIIVMLLAVGLTVVFATVFKSNTETQITKLEEENQKALAAAEAAIEAAIRQGSSVSFGSGSLSSISDFQGGAEIKTTRSDSFVTPLLQKDEQYTFYLSDYPSWSSPYNGNLTIYYDSQSVGCNNLALEITLIYGNSSNYQIKRYIADTGNRLGSNTDDIGLSLNNNLEGVSFSCSTSSSLNIGSFLNAKVLIVRPLFSSTKIGFSGNSLPLQGKTITSEARSLTGVSKKIQLFQSYPQIPAEFFVTSF